jgi:hypothetical protein
VSVKVSTDTITDAQIQYVRRAMIGYPHKTEYHRTVMKDCEAALEGDRTGRASAANVYNEMLGESPSPGKLTAASITDAQIRELLDSLVNDAIAMLYQHKDARQCRIALGFIRKSKIETAAARARCAEILNERARSRCSGRDHRGHVGDVCEGSCCTSCGGPIDENEECRC